MIVDEFEREIAAFSGSKYAIAVDTCTWAIFLCCKYSQVKLVTVPSHTYVSVPMSVIHSGGSVQFSNEPWYGIYYLKPYPIIDSACRFRRNMYIPGTLYCLSFQYRKHLPIGRGGMVLTDDESANNWLRAARFNGCPGIGCKPDFIGWKCYMEPERAARGLSLFQAKMSEEFEDLVFTYPDLSTYEVFS